MIGEQNVAMNLNSGDHYDSEFGSAGVHSLGALIRLLQP